MLFAALLLALAILLFPKPSHAAFPCTWAPGEVQVGVNNGVPLCEQRGGSSQGTGSAQMVWVDNHYALAGHNDAVGTWTAIGYSDGEAAKQAAMNACMADMGAGCIFFLKSFNSSYATGMGRAGAIYADWDSTVAKARKRFMDKCQKNKDFCVELSTGTAKPGRKIAGTSFRYTPEVWRPKGNFRHVYSAAAWVDPSSSVYPLDVWISSGYSNSEDASRAARNMCTSDSGAKCEHVLGIASAFIYVALTDSNNMIVGSSPTAKLAKSIMASKCDKKLKCKLTGVFDSRQSGVIRHRAGKAPQK